MTNMSMLKSIRPFLINIVRSGNVMNKLHSKRWCTAAHSLAIKERIKDTRERALLGGGQIRIDKQHQKVFSMLFSKLL